MKVPEAARIPLSFMKKLTFTGNGTSVKARTLPPS
jgi:hypothetical protein